MRTRPVTDTDEADEVDMGGGDDIEDMEVRAMTRETEWAMEEAKRARQAASEIEEWQF